MLAVATLEEIFGREMAAATPFRVLTLLIFLAAITHTLLAHHFTSLADKIAHRHGKRKISILAEILYFLGEIEVVFALWVIPLVLVITLFLGWNNTIEYLNSRIYIEPFFIVIVMSIASTRPIVKLASQGVHLVGKFFGDSAGSWWLAILTIGPIFGSIITEVAAMTIAALLLREKIYFYNPTKRLAYGTMGLMFVNFSVGGVLTNFAAPPALTLSRCWNWDVSDFFFQFGWRVFAGILLANLLYFFVMKKDFKKLKKKIPPPDKSLSLDEKEGPIPFWITLIHLIFLAWTIIMENYLPIFLGSYLLFLGFHQATRAYQYPLNLKRPLMVGLFLAGLVIHSGFQGWWIETILGDLGYGAMMLAGTVLTAFNENTTVAHLACLIQDIEPKIQYALTSGLVAGGGLTIMAHAPNPAGQALLRPFFKKGISSWDVFLAALVPTLIFLIIFYFFPSRPLLQV